jgi:FtsP/CotA-like multicopper oxidase with cupredoxin domain
MGMTGLLYVRPAQNGSPIEHEGTTFTRFAYNCGDGSSGYDREFSFLLTELWPEAHYRDAHIQVTDWTDFNAAFWLLNGRAYPDTLAASGSWNDTQADLDEAAGRLRYNPIGSLVRVNEGDRVLLRMSNLGYQVHTMTLEGAAMRVIAKDASLLARAGSGGLDLSYETSGVEIGPGESRDVLFRAPSHSGTGAYDSYLLYDRNFSMRNNNGASGNGGQMTEVRVYPTGTLDPQNPDDFNS